MILVFSSTIPIPTSIILVTYYKYPLLNWYKVSKNPINKSTEDKELDQYRESVDEMTEDNGSELNEPPKVEIKSKPIIAKKPKTIECEICGQELKNFLPSITRHLNTHKEGGIEKPPTIVDIDQNPQEEIPDIFTNEKPIDESENVADMAITINKTQQAKDIARTLMNPDVMKLLSVIKNPFTYNKNKLYLIPPQFDDGDIVRHALFEFARRRKLELVTEFNPQLIQDKEITDDINLCTHLHKKYTSEIGE